MSAKILDIVRERCRWVANHARYVEIREELVPPYALSLASITPPQLDASSHWLGQGEGTVAFILVLDSINFGSGYFPYLRKASGSSGYATIAKALTYHFAVHGPPSAEDLSVTSPSWCASILGQDTSNPHVAELMAHYAQALRDLGAFLQRDYDGAFMGPIEDADGSAERLAELLYTMPLFNDVALYRGRTIPFLKRAQITPADLALAFERRGPGSFRDLARLTIFADNLVPHVLRVDGILSYAPSLSDAVEAGVLLGPGTPEEIELRACALHAVELMVEALREQGRPTTAMALDHILWNRGQAPTYKAIPRHRCRTTFY